MGLVEFMQLPFVTLYQQNYAFTRKMFFASGANGYLVLSWWESLPPNVPFNIKIFSKDDQVYE